MKKSIEDSYRLHELHWENNLSEDLEKNLEKDTVSFWRHSRYYDLFKPALIYFNNLKILTVGDGSFGVDAIRLKELSSNSVTICASDINAVLIQKSIDKGFLDWGVRQNAESLTFEESSFDFVFCKSAFHHFPRPMIALYEFLRVSRIGVFLVEPQDFLSLNPMNLLNFILFSFFLKIKLLIRKIFNKNFSYVEYEEVGNFVYSVSVGEFKKVLLGLNYRFIATKGLNDHYDPKCENEKVSKNSIHFIKLKLKITFQNFLALIRVRNHTNVGIFLLKDVPDIEFINLLSSYGYNCEILNSNPYVTN